MMFDELPESLGSFSADELPIAQISPWKALGLQKDMRKQRAQQGLGRYVCTQSLPSQTVKVPDRKPWSTGFH